MPKHNYQEVLSLISQMVSTRMILVENIIFDFQDQLSVLDPADDGEEFIEKFSACLETQEGIEFISYLLGVPAEDLEDWFLKIGPSDDE